MQDDDHLVTVLRSVERNALRVGLVDRAEAWPHGSLAIAAGGTGPVSLAEGPVPRDAAWVARVNGPIGEKEGTSFGAPVAQAKWVSCQS